MTKNSMDNDYKTGLYGMGGWSQFFFFCFLFFLGFILTTLILPLGINISEIGKLAAPTRITMATQSIGLFLLPSIAFAFLCHPEHKEFLRTDTKIDWALILLPILLIIVIQPLINCISYYNQQVILPESMSSIEVWMRGKEESSSRMVKLLFADRSITGLLLNLLVIAVVAGIAEEFFFRGCIQQIMQKIVINKHVAIWITAIIFSIIHFQFYGFIPRVLLGALLGYIFIWSGSIWIPSLIHIIHNGIIVMIMYLYHDIPDSELIRHFSLDQGLIIVLSSFILSGVILIVYIKRATGLKSEN